MLRRNGGRCDQGSAATPDADTAAFYRVPEEVPGSCLLKLDKRRRNVVVVDEIFLPYRKRSGAESQSCKETDSAGRGVATLEHALLCRLEVVTMMGKARSSSMASSIQCPSSLMVTYSTRPIPAGCFLEGRGTGEMVRG